MRKIPSDELKKIEVDILDSFHKFCCDNGLSYSLAGGTLLGAVRHKGFIPWDDDIDVLMPRKDYDKLISLEDSFPEPYEIRTIFSEKDKDNPFIYTYMKIVNTETYMIELPSSIHYETSVYMDVFPLDGLPSDRNELLRRYKRARKLINMGYKINISHYISKNAEKTFVKRQYWVLLDFFRRLLPVNHIFYKLNNYCKKIDIENARNVGDIVAGYYEREAMPREYFFPIKKIVFEDKEYYSMNNPDYYLSSLYGDYMKLPPEEKRVITHDNIAYWRS